MNNAVRSGAGLLWVDINEDTEEARHLLRDVFHAHFLAIDDCFNGRVDTPKVDDFGDYLFIVAQSIRYDRGASNLELTEVDLFLGPNWVVSSHVVPVPELNDHFDKACLNEHLVNRGADMLAQSILDALVDNLLPAVEGIDEELDAMEERIIDRPDRQVLPQVLQLRRHTMRLRRSILPQRDVVNRLSRGEYPRLIRRDSLIFYRDIYDHTVRIEEILESIRDVADSVLSTYLSAVNNRMNEVMKTLSVVTAIFLPLTLIASIFGTNLDYSSVGVESTHGFIWMILAMVVLAGGMILYFRYRDWF
ncbi:MAG: magnesium/cobalt transporter CorA [Dehalococcoidia bacterium]